METQNTAHKGKKKQNKAGKLRTMAALGKQPKLSVYEPVSKPASATIMFFSTNLSSHKEVLNTLMFTEILMF